jgi:hypothetical protein
MNRTIDPQDRPGLRSVDDRDRDLDRRAPGERENGDCPARDAAGLRPRRSDLNCHCLFGCHGEASSFVFVASGVPAALTRPVMPCRVSTLIV